jgi:nitrite reductase/ring-hydroxylating ferredoxin subunit
MLDRFRDVAREGLKTARAFIPGDSLPSRVTRYLLRSAEDLLAPPREIGEIIAAANATLFSPPRPVVAKDGPACGSAPAVVGPKPHTVARADELADGACRVVHAGDKAIALCRVGGELHALDNRCLHRGGPLGEGELLDGVLTCPWHGWRYDVQSGKCQNGPGATLARYPVRVEGEHVIVEV